MLTRRRFVEAALAAPSASSSARAPIDIGGRKQLFLDFRLIADARGIELRPSIPEIQRENLLRAEFPWEAARAGPFSCVLQEEKTRLWYSTHDALVPFPRRGEGARRFTGDRICYAESHDGILFQKPLVDSAGRSNGVLPATGPCIFRDPFDSPERRYKMLLRIDSGNPTVAAEWPDAVGANSRALYVVSSPDGYRWKRMRDPFLPFSIGSQKSVFWDERLNRWVVYVRGDGRSGTHYCRIEVDRHGWGQTVPFKRKPGKDYTVTPLLDDELPVALAADDQDPDDANIYSLNAWKYPECDDAYFAFVPIWYKDGSDRVEVQLALSRDGVQWQRPWRIPVIGPGTHGSQTEGQIWPAPDPVIRGDEIWLYFNGLPYRHWDFVAPRAGEGVTARAIFRLDGFVAAEARTRNAELRTALLRFEGRRLSLNCDAGAGGSCRVAIEGPDGSEIQGLGLDNAVPLRGNGTAAIVEWNSGRRPGELVGKPVRLKFAMERAKLYAFRFTP